MKKFGFSVLAASMLLSLAGLTSCVSETETADAGSATVTTRSVVFNISLPTGDPVHVGTRAIQEAGEYEIKSLKLLVFDAATDVLKSAETVTLTGDATAINEGATYRYTYTWNPSDGKTCRFLFVANEAPTLEAGTSTWTNALAAVSAEAYTFSATTNNLATVFSSENGLPMTGVAYYNVGSAKNEIIPIDVEGQNITVNVDMTRVVARVDVVNKTPNLYITDIRLVHANPQAYLLPHENASNNVVIPTGLTKVDGLLPYNKVVDAVNNHTMSSEHPLNGSAAGVKLAKAFYVYEDDIYENATQATLEAEALALQVTGKLGSSVTDGVDVFYQIPFTDLYDGTATPEGKSVEIKRNHLYTVNIGDGNAINVNTQIRPSVVVSDWDASAVSSTFEDAVFTSAPATEIGTYNRGTNLITLASNAAVTTGLSIDVTDTYTSSVNITGVEVLTANNTWEAAASASGWLGATVAGDGKSVEVTATANNDSGAAVRIGSIRITYTYVDGNNVTQPAKVVFSVKQPAS